MECELPLTRFWPALIGLLGRRKGPASEDAGYRRCAIVPPQRGHDRSTICYSLLLESRFEL